jgi:hypothetical protein
MGCCASFPNSHSDKRGLLLNNLVIPTATSTADVIPRDVLLSRMWNSVVCGEFLKCHTDHVVVESSDPILQVVQLMVKHGTDHCCVRRKIGDNKYDYCALFDWRDLSSLIVTAYKKNQLNQHIQFTHSNKCSTETNDASSMGAEEKIQTLNNQSASAAEDGCTGADNMNNAARSNNPALESFLHFLDIKNTPVELVANLSNRNSFIHVNKSTPALGGAQLLVGSSGPIQTNSNEKKQKKSKIGAQQAAANQRPELYRLAVFNKEKQYLGCFAQLDAVKFLKEKLHDILPEEPEQSLYELGLGQRRVLTIQSKAALITALTILHEKQLSSLAIVDGKSSSPHLQSSLSCLSY